MHPLQPHRTPSRSLSPRTGRIGVAAPPASPPGRADRAGRAGRFAVAALATLVSAVAAPAPSTAQTPPATGATAASNSAPPAASRAALPPPLRLRLPDTLVAEAGERREAPSWAVEGVPPAVWLLVEAASDTPDRDEAKRLYREAEDEARRAAAAAPDAVGTRFALAVVLGLRADAEGGRTKVRAASALHDELTAILAIEPDHARARHLLGRLHAGVMRMNGVVRWVATRLLGGDALSEASWEEAERHLAFAEREDPAMLDHHLQLANLYRDTGRPEQARAELEHVFAHEPTSGLERAVWLEAAALRASLGEGAGSDDPTRRRPDGDPTAPKPQIPG